MKASQRLRKEAVTSLVSGESWLHRLNKQSDDDSLGFSFTLLLLPSILLCVSSRCCVPVSFRANNGSSRCGVRCFEFLGLSQDPRGQQRAVLILDARFATYKRSPFVDALRIFAPVGCSWRDKSTHNCSDRMFLWSYEIRFWALVLLVCSEAGYVTADENGTDATCVVFQIYICNDC